ncbi:MAG: hypothetical protein AB7Y46_06080 [Armatimonadota bacterium]
MREPVHTQVLVTPLLFTLIALMAGGSTPAGAAVSILLDDFESGVGAWRTNDEQAAGARPSEIASIYTVGRRTDVGAQQAALIEFEAAEGTWASVSLPIDGATWAHVGVGQIAMWVRGDGSDNSVDLTLRTRIGEERRDASYLYRLSLRSREWERRAIRLFAFKDAQGNALDAEGIRNLYLLQFVKTGSWPTLGLYVDEIVAEPIPGAPGPLQPPSEQALSVRVDFGHTIAPVLAQVGVNLGGDAGPVLDTTAASAALGRLLRDLTPCVMRLRLADFWDARMGDYDLVRLSRAIAWAEEHGARALVCLSPARVPGGAGGQMQWDPELASVAARLAAMRRGGSQLRYYELFDSPLLTGQFADVSGLTAAYNALAARVLAADPEARVGGPGFASAWDANVRAFLEGANTLHFLSLHLYGAHNLAASDQELFESACASVTSDLPNQLSLQQVRHLAQALRRPVPELFVTVLALNSARRPGGEAADERILTPFGGAWTAAAVLSASAWADKLLHFKLCGDGWGMADEGGTASEPYTAAWLVRTYAPRGSTLSQLLRPADDLLVAAVWTPTARNLFVVYAGHAPRSVAIDAWGIGSPVLVRERRLTSQGELVMSNLPNTAAQSVEFDGPGVSVIQFVSGQ